MMKKVAEFYKALGDETRLKILQMLAEQEMCVCEILDRLDISQPAVSHHLKILKRAELVKDSREGKWIYYALNNSVFREVFQDDAAELVASYAAPIKRKLEKTRPSPVRTDPALCEKLIAKQKEDVSSGGD